MPAIILVRHGPVACEAPGLLSYGGFLRYCEDYEREGVAFDAPPPAATLAAVKSAANVFASPAPRSLESARLLGLAGRARFDSVFAEEPNVAPRVPGRWPPIMWFSLSRGAGAFDPARAAKRAAMQTRAEAAAQILVDHARDGPAALIGHGWFNRAIARALTGRNWRKSVSRAGPASIGHESRPWGYAIFSVDDEKEPSSFSRRWR